MICLAPWKVKQPGNYNKDRNKYMDAVKEMIALLHRERSKLKSIKFLGLSVLAFHLARDPIAMCTDLDSLFNYQ